MAEVDVEEGRRLLAESGLTLPVRVAHNQPLGLSQVFEDGGLVAAARGGDPKAMELFAFAVNAFPGLLARVALSDLERRVLLELLDAELRGRAPDWTRMGGPFASYADVEAFARQLRAKLGAVAENASTEVMP
ncbi:MAG: hypothetical protein AAGE52_35200 [Myxococcota bacterium]